MTEERRKQLRPAEFSAVQRDFDRTITDLGGGKISQELMTKKRIVKTPDSETTIEYELKVDPTTGQQYVEEKWTTTKVECAVCGRYASQVRKCEYCGNKICGQCVRNYYAGDYIGNKLTCKSCFEAKMHQHEKVGYS
jgi:ribosomal protein S14